MIAVALLAGAARTAGAAAAWVPLPAEPGIRVTLEKGRDLVLLVQARPNDDYRSIAARLLEPGRTLTALLDANPGRKAVRAGSWYRVPLEIVSPSLRERALRTAFPKDGPDENGWVHRPAASGLDTYGEGAWQPAAWFTGDGRNFETILRANGTSDPILRRDAEITVPAHLLLPPFRSAWEKEMRKAAAQPPASRAPARPPPAPGEERPQKDAEGERLRDAVLPATPTTGPSELVWGDDSKGDYAAYRLKPGEALYSAVVVRFTGRLDPEDVGEAAAIIAKRSGIAEMNQIPAGYTVKIPRDMVLPEFLPPEDRERKAVDEVRREAESVKNPVSSRNLQGIHVILDAGHGGIDPGAFIGGMAEHEVAYDVMCRVKRLLETETAAIVHPVIEDPAGGFTPRGGRVLRVSGREEILTTPAHVNGEPGDTSLGVNLRWILANAIQRRLVKSGVPPARIVFVSFHADVLHPSLRGAMIYVPGERYRRGSYACYDPECAQYAEARQVPAVTFSRSDRVRSEGLSRELAARLVRALAAHDVRIHPYQPVRDRIIRRGKTWLPAVLRGNAVPVKLLVEMANLNNPQDRARLADPAFRETFARAFTDALLEYYRPPAAARPRPASRASSSRGGARGGGRLH